MDKHDDCRERSAEQRDTKKQVLWKSLISHCHKKVKHATLWRHFSMWLFVFMSVCEYLIVHHDSVSCRGVKALEHTPVLTNCAVCESYLWLLCCSHQPWCIFEIEKKKALFTEYSSAQIYKVLCQDTETINQTQEINSYCINDELKFIDVQEQDCLPALVGGWGGRNFVGLL